MIFTFNYLLNCLTIQNFFKYLVSIKCSEIQIQSLQIFYFNILFLKHSKFYEKILNFYSNFYFFSNVVVKMYDQILILFRESGWNFSSLYVVEALRISFILPKWAKTNLKYAIYIWNISLINIYFNRKDDLQGKIKFSIEISCF